MKLVALAISASLVLAGCAGGNLVWERIDGQALDAKPEYIKEYQRSKLICQGRTDAAQIYNVPARDRAYAGCMAEQGYWLRTAGPQTRVLNL